MTDNISENVNMGVYGIIWTSAIQPQFILEPLYEVEGLSSFHLSLSPFLSPSLSPLGTFKALWLVNADQSGYIGSALIGQNKGALRPPAGLSRVSHPQVCPCTNVQRLD